MKMKKIVILLVMINLLIFLYACKVQSPNHNEKNEQIEKARNITYFLDAENNVPLVTINTKKYVFPYDKEHYIDGNLKITDQTDQMNSYLSKTEMGIRLRGNSSFECPKKSFRVKFKEKVSLFDLPAAKSWVLIANYYDKSNIRNYLAYLTANKLSNLSFQPSSILVEVVFNGEYLGLYLLCEQMQTGKGRVDIEDLESDLPKYFFELDAKDRLLADGLLEGVSFVESYGLYYGIKYPDEEIITKEQGSYLKQFLDNLNYKIDLKDDIQNLIDFDSLIDYYLILEFFKNPDGWLSSVYYYLVEDKLYAGPVWDFDISLHVVGLNPNGNNLYQWVEQEELFIKKSNQLYNKLFNIDGFYQMVCNRYQEIRSIFMETLVECSIVEEYLMDEMQRNQTRWPLPGDTGSYIGSNYAQNYLKAITTKDHLDYVKEELIQQIEVLDEHYLR